MTAPSERQLGFWMCVALVVGNMIGASIFLVPASLAPYGLNSVIAWLVTATGALFLSGIFAALSRAFPSACGPYDYTRIAFGDLAGFVVAWGYWISIWVSNAAIATGAVSYLSDLVPSLAVPPVSVAVIVGMIWLLTGVNIYGTRTAGSLQTVTTVLKIVPLVVVGLLGIYLFATRDPRIVAGMQRPTEWSVEAVTAAAALTLFSFLGLESATIPAGKVRDAERTIPRATLIGTVVTALVYLLSSSIVTLLIAPAELAQSHAPFAEVVRLFWGGSAGTWIALLAVVSAFGSLNGWILLQGELPFHMARQGTFPRVFARESRRHTPAASLCIGSILTTVLIAMNSAKAMVDIFSFMVLLGTCSTLIMYLLCAFAVLKLLRRRELPSAGPHAGWLAFVAIVSGVYSLWAIFGSGLITDATACGGERLICWAPWLSNPAILSILLTASGVPVFYLMRRGRAAALSSPG